MEDENIKRHYGTCDVCKCKHILILHFSYFNQPNEDFRICKDCIKKSEYILRINKWK